MLKYGWERESEICLFDVQLCVPIPVMKDKVERVAEKWYQYTTSLPNYGELHLNQLPDAKQR